MNLDRLNPQQREAVTQDRAPLLVLAGAGTGKTTVITYRLARYVEQGVYPDELLALTFTNKAAREMRGRAEALVGAPERSLTIGTFHSLCARVLRELGHLLGFDRSLSIYDSDDQLTLLKQVMNELGIDQSLLRPRGCRYRIEQWKNQGLAPEEVTPTDAQSFLAKKVYEAYERRALQVNAVDFGGLLVQTLTLLRNFEDARRTLRNRWSVVLVDEYQDTNRVQYEILRQLVTPAHSLTVVGDDDQSIYRWRGADIANILRFENDFPGARLVRLEQNYRSTRTILAAANAVIAHNAARRGKTLFTAGDEGPPLSIRLFKTEREEGEAIGDAIGRALSLDTAPSEIAVLYRTNAQSRPIEDALRRRNIPYAVYGGVRFYDRREIKDALGYLRLLHNPRSALDFLRAVNSPPRGIGKRSLERLAAYSQGAEVSLWEAAAAAGRGELPDLRGKARVALGEFVALLGELRQQAERLDPAALLELVLEESGYRQALQEDGTPESEERLENLKELLEALREQVAVVPTTTLASFLEEVALVADIDDMPEGVATVSLMSLHSAKGLEFEWVFMPGMEEGVFPHHRSATDRAELEEERRLCYVGITRAKRHLGFSAVQQRYGFGRTEYLQPSRFLHELPVELLDLGGAPSSESLGARALGDPVRARPDVEPDYSHVSPHDGDDDGDVDFDPDVLEASADPVFDAATEAPIDEPAARPVVRAAAAPLGRSQPAQGFAAGMRVYHRTFGEGAVLHVQGHGKNERLVIRFETVGEKSVVARFVERRG